MKSLFATRLFRLFLLFALVPAVGLVLVGYYLAVENSSLPPSLSSHYARDLNTYYGDLLFQRLDSCLMETTGNSRPSPMFDFLFRQTGADLGVQVGDTTLVRKLTDQLEMLSDRRRGFARVDGRLCQFVCRQLSDTILLCAGVVHSDHYSQLMTSVQNDYASGRWAKELRPHYLSFLLLVFAVLVLVTAAAAYFLAARFADKITRPLIELCAASREIAAGNFKQQVGSTGEGEIRELIDSFNIMARRLDRLTTRLAQSERVAAWRHVARRFAHELKNPLQPILISLYRLEKSLDGPRTTAREALQAASQEIRHLTQLADRFSQLAQLPSPDMRLLNLNQLLQTLASLYHEQLAAYRFSLQLPSQTISVDADQTYLREALHNLLQNARDASSEQGRITVELQQQQDAVAIIVEDTGRGMSPDEIAAAPMPYFTTKEKGSGLGLAIVEKMISEMGGQLLIDSRQGHGTRVTILLPRRKDSQ